MAFSCKRTVLEPFIWASLCFVCFSSCLSPSPSYLFFGPSPPGSYGKRACAKKNTGARSNSGLKRASEIAHLLVTKLKRQN